MREEFLLDALVDYQIEPEDPTRTIPNPERRALDKEIQAARADLARLEREYGAAAASNAEQCGGTGAMYILWFIRGVVRGLITPRYRPELHYMRGPGPKWIERHGSVH